MSYTYYHNPRCSKSRQGLELLETKGIKPEVIEYLKTGLNLKELESILKKLEISPLEGLIRTKEASFKEAGLKGAELSSKQWLEEIVKNPVILERPILVSTTKAAIGRPPENFLEII